MTSEQVSLFNTQLTRNKLVKSNYKRFDIYKLQEKGRVLDWKNVSTWQQSKKTWTSKNIEFKHIEENVDATPNTLVA